MTPPDATGLPPFLGSSGGGEQERPPSSPLPPTVRFEFYTDPLAAFSGTQKKKKNPMGSSTPPSRPFGPAGSPTPRQPPLLPFWQSNFYPNPNLTPPGSCNTPGPPNCNPNLHPPGIPGPPNYYPNSTPSGSHNTPSPAYPNPNITPPGGYKTPYSNPGPPAYGPRSAFRSPHPPSSPHHYSSAGFSANSPSHQRAAMSDGQSSARSYGSSGSWGSFNRSPGGRGSPGGSKDSRSHGRSGGRSFQRPYRSGNASALANPELFAKKSMLIDPWKGLVPMRLDSVALRLDTCPGTDPQDWLPNTISKKLKSADVKSATVSMSGPSLAESLAASFADAVAGEGGI